MTERTKNWLLTAFVIVGVLFLIWAGMQEGWRF